MRRPIFIALPIVGLVALGAYAYYRDHAPTPVAGAAPKAAAGQAAGGPPPGAPVAVEVAAVKTARVQEDVAAIGTLRSNESVVVRPWISIEKSLLSRHEVTRNSPEPSGISGCVIEQTIPGSVLSARTDVRN